MEYLKKMAKAKAHKNFLELGKSSNGIQLAYRPFVAGDLVVALVQEEGEDEEGEASARLKNHRWSEAVKELTWPVFKGKPKVFFVEFENWRSIVRLARTFPAVTRAVDRGGDTLLHASIDARDCATIIKALLDVGFDPAARDGSGMIALHGAVVKDCLGCFLALTRFKDARTEIRIKNGKWRSRDRPPQTDDEEMERLLGTTDGNGHNFLTWLAISNSRRCMEFLLENANTKLKRFILHHSEGDNYPALEWAAFFHNPGVLGLLLREGRALSLATDSLAAFRDFLRSILFTILMRKDKEPVELTPKLSQCVVLLLDHGADLRQQTSNTCETVLHMVAQGGLADNLALKGLVDLLIKRGADPGVPDQDGKRASDVAREHGKIRMAEYLDSRTKTRLEVREMYRNTGDEEASFSFKHMRMPYMFNSFVR